MSMGNACKCMPRDVEVTQYKCNHSAFSGYRYTPSDYSAVRCKKCGARWRTKGKWVEEAMLAQ